MSRFIAILLLVAVLLSAAVRASPADLRYLQSLDGTRYHEVHSADVGRSYHVFVKPPAGYESADRRYPTVYLLDGGALFPLLTAYYRYLEFGGETPELVIVGISYGSDSFEGGNYRSSDYTAPSTEREYWGGAEKFQAFLAETLLPLVEREYRSDASRRILFGQSLGGQFVLYTAMTRPDLFWGHIASNPALHRNLDFFLEAVEPTGAEVSRLFVASGTADDPQFREPALAWVRHWESAKTKPWLLETRDLVGHTHMSAPPAAFRAGLSWLFADAAVE